MAGFYQQSGFSVVGMTCYPECALAREAEICFVNISMPTDVDVYGLKPVSAAAVVKSMKENIENVRKLLYDVVPRIPEKRSCDCGTVLDISLY